MKIVKIRWFMVAIILIILIMQIPQKSTDNQNEKVFSEDEFIEEPPQLTIIYQGESYETVRGSYNWSVDLGNGHTKLIHADALSPNEAVKNQKKELIVDRGSFIQLKFDVEPDEKIVNIWNNVENIQEKINLVEGNSILIPNSENTICYLVRACWDEGNAYYVFKVEEKED